MIQDRSCSQSRCPATSPKSRAAITVSGVDADLVPPIRRAARETLRAHGYSAGSLEIAVVDGARMRRLHRRWLGQDAVTDVLSFDFRDRPLAGQVDGQLIVCSTVARRVAQASAADWRGELLLYVVHGCLHLCGFDDRRRGDAATMHREEDRLLTDLGWGPIFSGRPAAPAPAKPERPAVRSKKPRASCRKSRR